MCLLIFQQQKTAQFQHNHIFPIKLHLEHLELVSGGAFDPWLVVCHPHVDSGQIRVSALDAVRDRPGQDPAAVVLLDHQRPAAIALSKKSKYLLGEPTVSLR